jgi:redox-sensitive bicupin YhaK (pirin superfamily)
VKPGWGMRKFPKDVDGALQPLADGRAGADGSALPLHADAAVFAGRLRAGQSVRQTLGEGRVFYLVPATGAVTVNGVAAHTRDGVTIADESDVVITASEDAELVLVDVRAAA